MITTMTTIMPGMTIITTIGRHDARVKTFSLMHDRPLPFSAIEMFLDLLRSAHGERLLRMKGIIETGRGPVAAAGRACRAVDAASAGAAAAWPDATRGTRLVLITLDMPEDYVRRLFAARRRASLDARHARPRGARADNPLAIAGHGRPPRQSVMGGCRDRF